MQRLLSAFAAAALLSLAPLPAGADGVDGIPNVARDLDVPALLPVLEQASMVMIHPPAKDDVRFTTGVLLIDAPRERVWDLVVDYSRYPELIPSARNVEHVATRPDGTATRSGSTSSGRSP